MIEVRESPGKGRGVFATRRIGAGEVLCCDPVVEFPDDDLLALLSTRLRGYWWDWRDGGAIVLGLGSMMNHGHRPNAANRCHLAGRRMEFYAARDIEPGEEITLDYMNLSR